MLETRRKYTRHPIFDDQKTCSRCGKTFPKTEQFFRKDKKSPSGLAYMCKPCSADICKKSLEKNKETHKKYQQSPSFVYSQLKYQAKKRGITFEISREYYEEKLAHKPCFYCGSKKTKHWVDRADNDHGIGYTEKNTVPCCELCNKMKAHRSHEVFIRHCSRVATFNKTDNVVD